MRLALLRLFALVTALMLAAPAQALARTRYLCHMSGRIGDSCCCRRAEPKISPPASEKTVEQPDCCERIQHSEPSSTPANREALQSPAPAGLVVLFAWASAVSPAEDAALAPGLARAPPLGRPLFLVNCALLI
jgi:hypothetical protein